MINLAGVVRLNFSFPALLPQTYDYFCDLETVLPLLPYIDLIRAYPDGSVRLLYETTEFGAYTVRLYCDMKAELRLNEYWIHLTPAENDPPVEERAGVSSSTARGYFSGEGRFSEEGQSTRVKYEFELRAEVPAPAGMRLMPGRVVNGIAKSIAKTRMREIAEGFAGNVIAAYPDWLERQHSAQKQG